MSNFESVSWFLLAIFALTFVRLLALRSGSRRRQTPSTTNDPRDLLQWLDEERRARDLKAVPFLGLLFLIGVFAMGYQSRIIEVRGTSEETRFVDRIFGRTNHVDSGDKKDVLAWFFTNTIQEYPALSLVIVASIILLLIMRRL